MAAQESIAGIRTMKKKLEKSCIQNGILYTEEEAPLGMNLTSILFDISKSLQNCKPEACTPTILYYV